MGNWCGYVAVPPGHPSWGVDYNDVHVEVHGGLTYADLCDGAEGEGICHVPNEGEPANVWWLGFDCAHYMDVVPSMLQYHAADSHSSYKDLAYVRSEVNSLADQLADRAPAAPVAEDTESVA
jgi:hypothetical protein